MVSSDQKNYLTYTSSSGCQTFTFKFWIVCFYSAPFISHPTRFAPLYRCTQISADLLWSQANLCFSLPFLSLFSFSSKFGLNIKSGQAKSSWDRSNLVMTGQVKFGLVKSDRSSQKNFGPKIFGPDIFVNLIFFLTQDCFLTQKIC